MASEVLSEDFFPEQNTMTPDPRAHLTTVFGRKPLRDDTKIYNQKHNPVHASSLFGSLLMLIDYWVFYCTIKT
ncbi:hypothetical protein KEM48_003831 [Puccinia striiformis f. sp. tritici PST-130]|nr:hypothetical protein KEM48_003831 [Puccinia striiformis f. sp. tritici PST-130]